MPSGGLVDSRKAGQGRPCCPSKSAMYRGAVAPQCASCSQLVHDLDVVLQGAGVEPGTLGSPLCCRKQALGIRVDGQHRGDLAQILVSEQVGTERMESGAVCRPRRCSRTGPNEQQGRCRQLGGAGRGVIGWHISWRRSRGSCWKSGWLRGMNSLKRGTRRMGLS